MKKLHLCLILASFAMVLAGCGKTAPVSKYVPREPGEAMEITGSGFQLIASGDETELYIDPSTVTLRWQDKKTGEYQDTRVFDSEVADSALKNDLVAYYYSGAESNRYSVVSNMDTLTYCVETGNLSYEKLDNGVRIVYSISNDKVTYKDFPAYISDERFQSLVVSHCSSKQKKILKSQYRQLNSGDWSRTTNKDNPLAGLSATALYEIFYETGEYTEEELRYDNELYDKLDEMPQRQDIELAMDYYLDGNDLMVHINTAEISYNDDFPLKSLSVLPYFLSSKENDGYLFIPDGSGALINLDNTKVKEYQFSSRYWNGDILQTSSKYATTNAYMTAPVYGIKTGNHAILGIIEEGAEVCTLSAYAKGTFNNVPYSRASLSFAIREDQSLANYNSAIVNYTLRRVSDDYYTGNITLRYKFLTGDKADYAGMAGAYRDQLISEGKIKINPSEETAPIFIEMLGAIDSTKYFLGIPYKGTTTVTDFAKATEILKDMNEKGVKNIFLDYVGLANGGMLQRSCESVNIMSQLGGKSGLLALNEFAQSIDASVYPNFQLQTANTTKRLSKDKRAFVISGAVAQIYDFSVISHTTVTDDDYPTYIITPTYMTDYINNFSKSYSKLGYTNLASEDLFTFISPNYKKDENLSITNAMPYYKAAIENLSNDYSLMLSNPISEAWAYIDYAEDIPSSGLNLKVMDAYVPFLQMVLSGNITYSTEIINNNSYDMTLDLYKAMEYGAALKFRVVGADTSILQNTKANDVFLAEYDTLSDIIKDLYAEYSDYYELVKGAYITDHELYAGDGSVAKTTFSNGVEIIFNYTDEAVTVGQTKVEPKSYLVEKGR